MDDDRLMEDMNPQSIEILLDMGYELPSILLALRALRDSSSNRKKGYNPVGEVQKAIDWLNNYVVKQEEEQIKELQKQARMQQVTEEINVKQAIQLSA